jgi:hypothetical protein
MPFDRNFVVNLSLAQAMTGGAKGFFLSPPLPCEGRGWGEKWLP